MAGELQAAIALIEAALPPHAAGLALEHNIHKSYYETVGRWAEGNPAEWVSDEERAKAIETDSVWVLHWYPHTPVGFNTLAASSIEALLNAANDAR